MGLLSSGIKAVSKSMSKGKTGRTIVGKAGAKRKGINKAFENKLKNLSKKTGEAKQLDINALKGMKKRNVIDKDLLSDFKKVTTTSSKKSKVTPVDEVDIEYGNPNIDNMSDKEVAKWEKEYGSALKEAKKIMGLKKKRGGKISYRMTGGQVVSHGYD